MPLAKSEIVKIERVLKDSSLTEVHIEQDGERVVIGGAAPADAPRDHDVIAIAAPAAGTIFLGSTSDGAAVAEGDSLAGLHVLDAEIAIQAPASGRIAAILVEDGSLVSYGTELFLIEPEEGA